MLEAQNLKLNNGKHIVMKAILIQSSNRAKKVLKTNKVIDNNKNSNQYTNSYQVASNNLVEYFDDKGAKWTFKAGNYTYDY